MTDRPILFSAPMILALRNGWKTQTRRVLNPQPELRGRFWHWAHGAWSDGCDPQMLPGHSMHAKMKAHEGDRLWVRETLRFDWTSIIDGWRYDADKTLVKSVAGKTLETPTPTRWPLGGCVSIFMPRWASRLTLTITDVRVQRLQDISEEDAQAEGIGEPYLGDADPPFEEQAITVSRRKQFRNLWNILHGPDAWELNPWVVALTFSVNQSNIDAP